MNVCAHSIFLILIETLKFPAGHINSYIWRGSTCLPDKPCLHSWHSPLLSCKCLSLRSTSCYLYMITTLSLSFLIQHEGVKYNDVANMMFIGHDVFQRCMWMMWSRRYVMGVQCPPSPRKASQQHLSMATMASDLLWATSAWTWPSRRPRRRALAGSAPEVCMPARLKEKILTHKPFQCYNVYLNKEYCVSW